MSKFNSEIPQLFYKHLLEGRSIWSFPRLLGVYPSTMQKWLKKSTEMTEVISKLRYVGPKRKDSNTIICPHCKKANFWFDTSTGGEEIHPIWMSIELDELNCVFCKRDLRTSVSDTYAEYTTISGKEYQRPKLREVHAQ